MNLSNLEKNLGIKFKSKKLLEQSFVHRSYLNENPSLKMKHNERLEYLGDSVLGLIVADYLFSKYPDKDETPLSVPVFPLKLMGLSFLSNRSSSVPSTPAMLREL